MWNIPVCSHLFLNSAEFLLQRSAFSICSFLLGGSHLHVTFALFTLLETNDRLWFFPSENALWGGFYGLGRSHLSHVLHPLK